MNFRKQRLLVAALLLPLLTAASGYVPDQLVTLPDGRRININCTGGGKPTVLLESGFQSWSFAWITVQRAIADRYRVCSYDRAGLGFSDAGPFPRDGAAIAADLDAIVRAAKLPPPYIVVGHSSGALYMRLFADRRPQDIAGMVLVDPSVEWQFRPNDPNDKARAAGYRECAAAAAAKQLPSAKPELKSCYPADTDRPFTQMVAALSLRPGYWETLASEYETLGGATRTQLLQGRTSYGDMPLVVLTAGGKGPPTPQSQAQLLQWSAMHDSLASRSTRGVNRIVPDTGHMIMITKAEAVTKAIDDVAAAARGKPGPT